MIKHSKYKLPEFYGSLLLLVLLYTPIFGHLNTLPIRLWDESRLAINACEMLYDGDFIVTHYNGQPDMWNTKPPLMIWFQALFMKVFGINELAVRLPSAFAALFTCTGILVFCKRFLRSYWFGFIVVLILITSQGYVTVHGTRTGDYDALLAFFTTAMCLFFFTYCETKRRSQLYLFFVSLSLAILTKSVTALLFLPPLALYALLQREFIPFLKNKDFYIGLLVCIIPVLSYYLLRETYNPGYLKAVQENELGGRYLDTLENHSHGFWFYYDYIFGKHFRSWYLLIPCGIAVGLLSKNDRIKRLTLFCTLLCVCFLLVISNSGTKLEWYDLPMYPFLSIIAGVALYLGFVFLQESTWFKGQLKVNVIPFLLLFIVFYFPYQSMVNLTYKPKELSKKDKQFYEIGYFLQNAAKGKKDLHNTVFINNWYQPQNQFYIRTLQENGVNISVKKLEEIQPGDTVILYERHLKERLLSTHLCDTTSVDGTIITYKIHGKKN